MDKVEKQFRLVFLLLNRRCGMEEVCDELDITRRTAFRYFEQLRRVGFDVKINSERKYHISHDSIRIREMNDSIRLSKNELELIKKVMDSLPRKTNEVRSLISRLNGIYDINIAEDPEADRRYQDNLLKLREAMRERRQIFLRGYSSANSMSTSDRLVEPFELMKDNTEIRCFEVDSHMNKTFKISRIGNVEILENRWAYDGRHRKSFTDIFGFSSEERTHIILKVDRLASHLLWEEYSIRLKDMDEDGMYTFECDVCSFKGIGRFVMGLLNSVKIIEGEGLISYLEEEINKYRDRTKQKTDLK